METYAKKEGRQVILGNEKIKIIWSETLNEYRARVGAGIWYNSKGTWMKIADLAEGEPSLVEGASLKELNLQELDPTQIIETQPTNALVSQQAGKACVNLTGGVLKLGDLEWKVEESWSIEERRLKFEVSFIPQKGSVEGKILLGLRFNVFPNRFRVITLPSYCGFFEGIAYAIYPVNTDPWWMRLDGPKLIKNVHYPFTYKPTKLAENGKTITLKGYLFIDECSPEELLAHLEQELKPQADPLKRSPEQMAAAAYECIEGAFKAAVLSGHFKDDEGALLGKIEPDGFKHHHMKARPSAYDVGFSLGWSGQCISSLLNYANFIKSKEPKNIALKVANWISRHTQTPYGAFHEIIDLELKQGADFVNEDRLYIHTSARNAAELLYAYQREGKKEHLDAALRTCEWLLRIQEPDGGFPWQVVDSTGLNEGFPAYAASSAEAITALSRAWSITNDARYLDAAIACARWASKNFIDQNQYGGFITDDLGIGSKTAGFNRWETPCGTAICFLIDGLLSLYEITKNRTYLNDAERAGHFLCLYQWPWEFPVDCLSHRIKGTLQASSGMNYCIDQTFGSELPLIIEAFILLSEATSNNYWVEKLKMAVSRLADYQFYDESSPYHGSVIEGWSLTKDVPLPKVQGNVLFTNRIPDIMIRYRKLTTK